MTGEREMTAHMTSVGAEIGQSLTTTNSIIPQVPDNCNPFYGENFAAPAYGEPPRSPGAMQTVSSRSASCFTMYRPCPTISLSTATTTW